jgi:aldose 1-epimerase
MDKPHPVGRSDMARHVRIESLHPYPTTLLFCHKHLRRELRTGVSMTRQTGAIAIIFLFLLVVAAVVPFRRSHAGSNIDKQAFGKTRQGEPADLYVLTNNAGFEVAIANYGGTLVSIKAPDRKGQFADVILGYDTVTGYEAGKSYFGGTIGRYANRIAHGQFVLNGRTYTLARNDGENHLHGGLIGFNKRVWTAKDVSSSAGQALELSYLSKDGEEGYPGNLSVTAVFTVLADRNALKIDYLANTDKETVLNLTNHAYFNLGGQGVGDILGQQLLLHASRFTPVDSTLIPTGEVRNVHNTPFDFLHPTAIGARIDRDDEQLKFGKGYDHNWVLDHGSQQALASAAEVYDPESGRTLTVSTTEPGIQFYSGNFLDGTEHGKDGKAYTHRSALCLETQHFPDSPNHASFPTTVLKPGREYRSTTVYRFSTK